MKSTALLKFSFSWSLPYKYIKIYLYIHMKYSIVLQVSAGIFPCGGFHIAELAEIYFKRTTRVP